MSRRPVSRARSESRFVVRLGVAATVVIAVVGYISYNALSGLPLQDRYHVTVALPDAERLVPTNDVRIANIRVGQVSSVSSGRTSAGRPYAKIGLALERSVGDLPRDSSVRVRAASPLGQTYVEVTLGSSSQTVPEDGSLPLDRAQPTVVVSDLFQIFNGRARADFQTAFGALGDGFAGRGPATNSTIGSLSRLMRPLQDVSATLASPRTRLPQLISGLAATMDAVAPVRQQLARLVADGAVTFGALERERAALGRTIEIAPQAERSATVALKAVRPGLHALARAAINIEPSVRRLPRAVGAINDALRSGPGAFDAIVRLRVPLVATLAELEDVSERPSTTGALRKLGDISRAATDALGDILPAQESCNVFALVAQNMGSVFGSNGTAEGPIALLGLSTLGQPGEQLQSAAPAPSLHVNSTPAENATRCDSNNEEYTPGRQLLVRPESVAGNSGRITSTPPGVLDLARSARLLATKDGR